MAKSNVASFSPSASASEYGNAVKSILGGFSAITGTLDNVDAAKRQKILQSREDEKYAWLKAAQEKQVADEATNKAFFTDVQKGPKSVLPDLTGAAKTAEGKKVVDNMSYTPEELKFISPEVNADGNQVRPGVQVSSLDKLGEMAQQLRNYGANEDVVKSIVNKTQQQLSLSNTADTLQEVKQSPLEYYRQLAGKYGYTKEIQDKIEAAQVADLSQQQAKVAGIDKSLSDINGKIYKASQDASKTLYTNSGSSSRSNGSNNKLVKTISDKKVGESWANYVTRKIPEVTTTIINGWDGTALKNLAKQIPSEFTDDKKAWILNAAIKPGWLGTTTVSDKLDFDKLSKEYDANFKSSSGNNTKDAATYKQSVAANIKYLNAQKDALTQKRAALLQSPEEIRLGLAKDALLGAVPANSAYVAPVASSGKVADKVPRDEKKVGDKTTSTVLPRLDTGDYTQRQVGAEQIDSTKQSATVPQKQFVSLAETFGVKMPDASIQKSRVDGSVLPFPTVSKSDQDLQQLRVKYEQAKQIGSSNASQLKSQLINKATQAGYLQASSPKVVDTLSKVEQAVAKIKSLKQSNGRSQQQAALSEQMKLVTLLKNLRNTSPKIFSMSPTDEAIQNRVNMLANSSVNSLLGVPIPQQVITNPAAQYFPK